MSDHMENEVVIEKTVNLVIQALQQLGFFEHKPKVTRWHLRWDREILSSKGFRAAATADGENPVIVLSENFSLENDIDVLIHESIHLAQIIKGDLVPGYGDGISIWKGKKYNNLPPTHEWYFEEQPWEEEVRNIFPNVFTKMKELSNRT